MFRIGANAAQAEFMLQSLTRSANSGCRAGALQYACGRYGIRGARHGRRAGTGQSMEFHHYDLPGPVEIVPRRIGDERGYFSEVFRLAPFVDQVGAVEFVQENESLSAKAGTVRGLHFQTAPFAQGKLVRCTAGAIFDVVVDLRRDSPMFGDWVAVTLTPERGNQLWVPPGFAHGFCTLLPGSVVNYKVTAYYSAEHDKGVAWDDPAIGIEWPAAADPDTLSAKDRVQPLLADLPAYFTLSA